MEREYKNRVRPIFITGCPRSGASMFMGILEICRGIHFGDLTAPKPHSPRGMKESENIFSQVTEPYLKSLNVCPAGQNPLPDADNLLILRNFREQVISVLESEGYQGGRWAYKSNKLTLTWPIWHYAFPEANWIIVRRRTGDIVKSCMRTKYMKAFDNPEDWKSWVREYETRFVQMIQAGVNVKIVWPDRMVEGHYHQLYETIEWLGLNWDSDMLAKVCAFIDPKFWKVRKDG